MSSAFVVYLRTNKMSSETVKNATLNVAEMRRRCAAALMRSVCIATMCFQQVRLINHIFSKTTHDFRVELFLPTVMLLYVENPSDASHNSTTL